MNKIIMLLDLHIHTTASDGQYTPSEIVSMAIEKKISVIAITDHDTVSGIAEGRAKAQELGIRFIPGVEISTQEKEEIHILGYGIDETSPELNAMCREYAESRETRAQRICDFFQRRGILIDLEEIKEIAGPGIIARSHFARFLQNHGYVCTRKEAFDQYLDTPEFHEETDRVKPTPEEAIHLIHQAGGRAVLAHPGFLRKCLPEMEPFIAQLKETGLDGIECFYSKHTPRQAEDFLRFAKRYNLKISCGSDFHGEQVKPDVKLGMEIDKCYAEKLIQL